MQLAHDVLHSKRMRTDVGRVDPDANALDRDQFANVLARLALHAAPPDAVCKSNLQPDFNVRVCECFDTSISAVLRELAESNRFVQKSAESTSI